MRTTHLKEDCWCHETAERIPPDLREVIHINPNLSSLLVVQRHFTIVVRYRHRYSLEPVCKNVDQAIQSTGLYYNSKRSL